MFKKLLIAALFLTFAAAPGLAQEKTLPELQVVPTLDLARYAGKWYEIARLPNRFEKDCAGDVTATYALLPKSKIKVVNQCRKADGEVKTAKGEARLADKKSGPNSKLEVRFAPGALSFLPFVWADYWVVDLAPDYSYAVIGEPKREYLWILAREPRVSEAIYQRAVGKAKEQSFDVARLIKVKQSGD